MDKEQMARIQKQITYLFGQSKEELKKLYEKGE